VKSPTGLNLSGRFFLGRCECLPIDVLGRVPWSPDPPVDEPRDKRRLGTTFVTAFVLRNDYLSVLGESSSSQRTRTMNIVYTYHGRFAECEEPGESFSYVVDGDITVAIIDLVPLSAVF
jgi:hypothetical protein